MSKDKFDDMVDGDAAVPAEHEAQTTAIQGYAGGAPDFDSGDVFIPNLRLAQGLTPEVQQREATPGQWLILGFPPENEVTVVPLLYAKAYEHRDPEDDTKTIECPNGDTCQLREWTGDKEHRKAPECTKVYRYVVYSVTHGTLATLRFRRSAERAGRIFNTAVARGGLGNVALTLKSAQSAGKNNVMFFVPTVSPIKVEAAALDEAAKRLAAGV